MTVTPGIGNWATWALGLSLAFNLAFVAAFTFAECRQGRGVCSKPEPAQRALKLTPEQQKALKAGRAKLEGGRDSPVTDTSPGAPAVPHEVPCGRRAQRPRPHALRPSLNPGESRESSRTH